MTLTRRAEVTPAPTTAPATLTAVVADDSPLFRDGVAAVLTGAGIAVLRRVGDAEALLDAVAELSPAVALVDVRLPPTFRLEGLEAAERIRGEHSRTAVLVLSGHVEGTYARRLMTDGASGLGYLLKDRAASTASFVECVVRVARGGSAFDPEVVATMLSTGSGGIERLTAREQEILQLMGEGLSNAGIGRRLFLGERTVESHVASIFRRLELRDEPETNRRVQAVLLHLRAHETPG